jgi:ribosomal protein S13
MISIHQEKNTLAVTGMISNKNASQVLNTSNVDEDIEMQKLQNDRLDKIQDIERSLKVDDRERYQQDATSLSALNNTIDNPYGYTTPRKSNKNKFYGAKTEYITDMKKFSNTVDRRRTNDSSLLNMKFNPKPLKAGRHLDDPFIYNLGA